MIEKMMDFIQKFQKMKVISHRFLLQEGNVRN